MATPLTATHRVKTQWINEGQLHTFHQYCKRGADVGGVAQLVLRDGISTVDFPVACSGIHDAVGQILAPTAAGLTHTLEERSGLIWNPVAFASTSATGTGTIKYASEFSLILRDTAFDKIRVCVLETSVGYIGHSNTGLGLPADTDLFTGYFNGDMITDDVPYMWQKSRGDNYILDVGAVAGGTYDLNDKIKRSRGFE